MNRLFRILAGLVLMCSMSGCCLMGHGMGYGAGYPYGGGGGCGSCGGCGTGGCGVAPGGYPSAYAPGGFAPATAFAAPNYPVAVQSIGTVQ